mmetsp:Transcript_37429/g.76302  ORF Transcript_37429/g.76302 Transcript_37429/m.76302 type:complete len:501 (-) Transcript_37429:109-1611(-)
MPEVILVHRHTVQNLRVDLLVLNVNQIHLLPDALHSRLGTQRRNVRSHKTMRLLRNRLRVNVFIELHVASVNTEDLKTAILVGHSNVDLAVETSESAEGRVHRVGAVRSSDDHDRGTLLQAVHQREELGDNAPLDLAVGLVPLGGNGVDLIDEDDGRGILLGLLERLSEVRLGLSRHLGHDLGAVDQKEKGSSLIRHSSCDEGLTGSGRSVQKHTTGRLDAQRPKQGGMAQRQFNHLTDLRHLLPATTDIVVSHVIQLLLVLPLDGLALAVDDRVGSHNTVGGRVRLHHLELHGMHGTSHKEKVTLLHRAVRLQEVRLQVHVEEVSRNTLDGVVQGEDVDPLPVRHVPAGGDCHDVREADAQVLAHHLVHAHVGVVAALVSEDDADGVAPLLALEEDGVAAEELELLHLGGAEGYDRVVVIGGVVDDEAVGGALLAKDGVLHVGIFAFTGHGHCGFAVYRDLFGFDVALAERLEMKEADAVEGGREVTEARHTEPRQPKG